MSSFRPGPNIQLEVRLIGTVLAGIAYAIVAILFISCVRLKALPTDSRRLYRFRIFYIIIMFLLSTVALVQEVAVITVAIFKSDADHIQTIPIFSHFLLSESDIPSYLPFIIFGADMFMIWRCLVLYRAASRVLWLLLLGCFVSGFLIMTAVSIILFFTSIGDTPISLVPILSFTLFNNLFLATTIVSRIVWHQNHLGVDLGSTHKSLYTRIIFICVESCALIALFSGASIILVVVEWFHLISLNSWTEIPLLLLPHFCVISPYLLIYRVARGKDSTTVVCAPSTGPGSASRGLPTRQTAELETMRFNENSLSTESQNTLGASEVHDIEFAERFNANRSFVKLDIKFGEVEEHQREKK